MQCKTGSQAFGPTAVGVLMRDMTTYTSASRTAGTAAFTQLLNIATNNRLPKVGTVFNHKHDS